MKPFIFYGKGADGLSDLTELLSTLVKVGAERVEQGGLAVVHVPHNRNYGRPHDEALAVLFLFLLAHDLSFDVILHADELDSFVRQDLELVCVDLLGQLLHSVQHVQLVALENLAQFE